jgi:hypothetical protein
MHVKKSDAERFVSLDLFDGNLIMLFIKAYFQIQRPPYGGSCQKTKIPLSVRGEAMAWDEEYEEGFLLNEEDDIALIEDEDEDEGEFFSDRLREELDYEQYEEERDEADSDDFPESFEEWKVQKEQEKWEFEREAFDPDLMEYEE